jgi:hypothetical protein
MPSSASVQQQCSLYAQRAAVLLLAATATAAHTAAAHTTAASIVTLPLPSTVHLTPLSPLAPLAQRSNTDAQLLLMILLLLLLQLLLLLLYHTAAAADNNSCAAQLALRYRAHRAVHFALAST